MEKNFIPIFMVALLLMKINDIITDLTVASTPCDHGDSGGIVYTYISSKNTRLTVGIIHGFTVKDTLTIFSKANNVLKDLNIERY